MFISFFNPQGNFDQHDSRWASHPDFGGQLVYVKEVALEMAKAGHRVDIVTRLINDDEWREFSGPFDYYEGVKNLRIIRIKFGPDKFLNKERLWPYLLTEYVSKIINFYENEGQMPDAVTSHYGDGGIAAAYFKERTGIPFTFTAHSLGAQKMDKLGVNKYNIEEIDQKYNFTLRLLAERISMNKADKIVTSTIQERFSQYTHTSYQEAVVIDNNDKFAVVPPGVSLEIFDKNRKPDRRTVNFIERIINRDINPGRQSLPAVISSSRLDPKKNITAIVRAFGESRALQEKANLIIVTKGHKNLLRDYKKLPAGQKKDVVIEIMKLIDNYDLKGKTAMISLEKQENLADMYRYFAGRCSVFCLAALYEPFGLAPLEAMACGLPVVVTKFGGPAESLREGDQEYGILVDPNNIEELAWGLHSLISSRPRWETYAQKGYRRVLDKYTWKRTAQLYIDAIHSIRKSRGVPSIFDIPFDEYFLTADEKRKPAVETLKKIYLHFDILCIGETVIDFISTKKTNSLIDADSFHRYAGGNPAYVAAYVSRLSKKAALLTKLGKDHFGSYLENEFRKFGVNMEKVKHCEEYGTSVTFLSQTQTVPDFQSIYSADRKLTIKDVTPELIERADIIYTSLSSMVEEPSRSAIRKALRIARKEKKTIALDPNYHPKIWKDKDEGLEILAQVCESVDIVKPSLGDARHIFDYNMAEDQLVEHCINSFHEWGARIVVVTAKGRYAVLSEEGKIIKVTEFPEVNILDVTGGGRAFMSGFLVAYLDGLSYEECLHVGHEVAAIALQSLGPFPKTIFRKEIYEKVQARKAVTV